MGGEAMKRLWVLGLVLFVPVAALAQGSSANRTAPVSRDIWAASDGCENIPGQAHNSADCSRVDQLNPRDVLPDKPVSQMTGAERNLLRNHRILAATAATLEKVRRTAPRLSDEAVNAMIRQLAVPLAADARIPRWTEGLCVRTQGLAPELNAAVDRRIRQLASMVGAPVADEGCEINVAVLFEADPAEALEEVAAAHPLLFSSEAAAVMRQPVQAWYVSLSADGLGNVKPDGEKASALCDTLDLDARSSGMGLIGLQTVNLGTLTQRLKDKSRYCGNSNTIKHTGDGVKGLGFSAVTVIAASDLLEQHDPAAVVDHIALLALSRVSDSEVCQPVPTIANLLKKSCGPDLRSDEITASDLAFLVALYRAQQRETPKLQLGSIASEMKRALQGR
jgi:hypothetical protein